MVPATIGMDLGGTHLRAALVDRRGTATALVRRVLPKDLVGRRNAVAALADEILAEHNDRVIDGIGLAVAGTVSDGVLVWSANLGLNGIDFRSELQAATGHRTVVLNDARAAALAEAHSGAAVGAASVLMVTVGTGIGGGIVTDGRLYTGTGHAGEIGHLPLEAQGPLCRCGIHGCWEQLAGGRALDASAVATGRPDAAGLADAAARGDQVAADIIRTHASFFARGLDGLCAVLAPQLLILGGGIIARSGPVATAYLAAARKLHWHQGETREAALGDHAGLIGAALALQHEVADPC